ncbi:MAG: SCP2 sterol-binding domain-containing protein [Candidatus Helarchaeota archaeon]|nr:SCP2 sterol-binding domain-containing protein [Candidatus Helarchaeota archaeon]
MVNYLTKEWLEAGMNAINADTEIREAAKNLTAIFQHVVTEVPNNAENIYFTSEYQNGIVTEMKMENNKNPTYKLTANYEDWKQFHSGKLNFLDFVWKGKLKVEGKFPQDINIPKLIEKLSQIIANIPTEF